MRRTGFTLIELLVVIAIIAILAAILFPVFLKVKSAAGASQCLNNCKQIATGVSMYKDDFQGCWMACYHQDRPGTAGYDPVYRHAFWMRLLMPYVKTKRVYKCPAATSKFDETWTGAEPRASWPASNYGINECLVETIWAELAGLKSLNTESAIVYPSRTALLADCNCVVFWGGDNIRRQSTGVGHDGILYPDGMLRIKYPNVPTTPGSMPTYSLKYVRHDGRTMVVFTDLHVKALTTDQMRIENVNTDNVRMYPLIWPKAKPF